MTRAEIITIGTELLLGDVVDTNTSYIARKLKQYGIDLLRTITIGDNLGRIAEQIKTSLDFADIIITTGGLGPTVDDPTREAIAMAFSQPLEFHAELWEQISARFLSRGVTPTNNNMRQAFLPKGARVIQNPVGTAPAFWVSDGKKMVVSLPGVPDEMMTILEESVLPLLIERYNLNEFLKTRILHVCCMGESFIDNLIADLESQSNPTVGLCAHPGYVDIRIAAKSTSIQEAEIMIQNIEQEIRNRLSGLIYGIDEINLIDAIIELNQDNENHLKLNFFGFPEDFVQRQVIPMLKPLDYQVCKKSDLSTMLQKPNTEALSFLIVFQEKNSEVVLDLYQKTLDNNVHNRRVYFGPPAQSRNWALNTALGFVWKALHIEVMEKK